MLASLTSTLRALLTLGTGVTRGLPKLTPEHDPIAFFGTWFEAARRAGILLPESMAVATCTPAGVPSARMMLLKGFDAEGFRFFTNYGSRKASELDANPQAALVFFWPVLERQVRVEGAVQRLARAESERYFSSRPRGSRIAAWASPQSRSVADRAELERRFSEHERRFQGSDVPLPQFWGGYRLRPERIEFWQGRLNRLHDRLVYTRAGEGWEVSRLAP